MRSWFSPRRSVFQSIRIFLLPILWGAAVAGAAESADTLTVTDYQVAAFKEPQNPNGRPSTIVVALEVDYTLASQNAGSLRAGATIEGPVAVTTLFNETARPGRRTAKLRLEIKKFSRDILDVLVWLDKKTKDVGGAPEPLKFQKMSFDVSKL